MKSRFFMLVCSAVCLGIYYWGQGLSSSETAEKAQVASAVDDQQPSLPVVVAKTTRPLGQREETITRNQELPLEAVSLGEYIDPSDSSGNTYHEPVQLGEYINPSDSSGSTYHEPIQLGEYINPSDSSRSTYHEPIQLGEYTPLNSGSAYGSDREPVSIGEYVPID